MQLPKVKLFFHGCPFFVNEKSKLNIDHNASMSSQVFLLSLEVNKMKPQCGLIVEVDTSKDVEIYEVILGCTNRGKGRFSSAECHWRL